MEQRVTRLEQRTDKMLDELSSVRVNLATLTERVAHLPSKGFIVSALSSGVVLIGGLVVLADKIKAFFGL